MGDLDGRGIWMGDLDFGIVDWGIWILDGGLGGLDGGL